MSMLILAIIPIGIIALAAMLKNGNKTTTQQNKTKHKNHCPKCGALKNEQFALCYQCWKQQTRK